jgi:hypothetical protein
LTVDVDRLTMRGSIREAGVSVGVSSDPVEQLSGLVVRRLIELDLSAREAASRSRGRVSYSTIRNIARGTHGGKITDTVAEGLAIALDVPLAAVYEAARVPQPLSRWEWPEKFDRLVPEERRLIEELAAALLRARGRGLRNAG